MRDWQQTGNLATSWSGAVASCTFLLQYSRIKINTGDYYSLTMEQKYVTVTA